MKKIEWVYRELLYRVLERKITLVSQNDLAKACEITLSNVHFAIQPLVEMNAIEKKVQGFRTVDVRKILMHWASKRRLSADIVYKTRSNSAVLEIEKNMPAQTLFALYSAYKFRFKNNPADYGEVFVYGEKEKVEKRFPPNAGIPNVLVLKPDPHLLKFKQIPLGQLYVDLWNHNKWYAREFLQALDKKVLGEIQ